MTLLRFYGGEYQGNVTWGVFGVASLLFASYPWLRLRAMRKLGQRAELGNVIGASLMFLLFSVIALVQVLTHQRPSAAIANVRCGPGDARMVVAGVIGGSRWTT